MKRSPIFIAIIFLMMAAPVFAGEFQTTIDAFSYGPYEVPAFDGDVELTEGMDYELVYSNNTLPGRATVQIAGIGSYKGTATAHFIIVPARGKVQKLVSSKTAIRVRVAVLEGVTGYQYAWRAKGKAWKTAQAKAKVRIVKKLKRKTIYQVRVRAYKTIKGKKWYGKWSQVKTVRTK